MGEYWRLTEHYRCRRTPEPGNQVSRHRACPRPRQGIRLQCRVNGIQQPLLLQGHCTFMSLPPIYNPLPLPSHHVFHTNPLRPPTLTFVPNPPQTSPAPSAKTSPPLTPSAKNSSPPQKPCSAPVLSGSSKPTTPAAPSASFPPTSPALPSPAPTTAAKPST